MRLHKTAGTVCALMNARPWFDPARHFFGTFGFEAEAYLTATESCPESSVGNG